VLGDNANTNFVDFSTKGRSQFIQQLEEFINETEQLERQKGEYPGEVEETDIVKETITEEKPKNEIDLSEEDSAEPIEKQDTAAAQTGGNGSSGTGNQAEEFEKVMNNGMQFLSGLFKMATGKEMGMENQKIELGLENRT